MSWAGNTSEGSNGARHWRRPGQTHNLAPPMAMSVDVEDWFQVENLKAAIPRNTWDQYPLRVGENTRRILEVFSATDTKATFFCLGWVAERQPALIRRISEAGHEVASHGYAHELLYDIGPEKFRTDLLRAQKILEDATGKAIVGYRAPSFSVTEWALEILAEEGYRYDSSYFPATGHDRYAKLPTDLFPSDGHQSPPFLTHLSSGLVELSIPVLEVLNRPIPWGGGGYFRLYPPAIFRAGFAAAARQHGGAVLYLHPWEVDPDQPRISGIRKSHALRHYINLSKTEDRLTKLCETFDFVPCNSVL